MRVRGAQAGRGGGPYVAPHPRELHREAVIEWLTGLGVVQEAAAVARLFRIDPISVLNDEGDDWPQLVRLAAYRFVVREEEAAAKRAQQSRG